jgi:hypothetical protein
MVDIISTEDRCVPGITFTRYFQDRQIGKPIRVITKLPNSEQSYKGKVKTHKYINRQNQSTTGKLSRSFQTAEVGGNR